MSKSTENNLKDYFATQKRALHVLGLSLSPNAKVIYKISSSSVVLVMVVYVCFMLPDLFNFKRNFDYFDSWLYGAGLILAMAKMLTLFLNQSKLNNILNTLQSGVFVPNSMRGGQFEYFWIKKCVGLTTKLTITGMIIASTSVLACLMSSLLIYMNNGNKTLPFGSASILSDWNYKVALLYNSFVYGIAVEVFMVFEILYGSILAHICVQCKILQNFIREAIKLSRRIMMEGEIDCSEYSEIPYKYLKRTIKKIVIYHIAIINVAEDVEKVFNITILLVFTGMSVCICFVMFQASQYPFLDPNFFKYAFILVGATLPLITNSYWGSEVILESQAIAGACYEVDFVGTDLKFQKDLILIMRRSQRPIKLTAGKFAVLSLMTMVGVLRMAYSYFMLLREINPVE